MRACLGDVVDVKARVDVKKAGINVVELVASIIVTRIGVWQHWEWTWRRRELQILFEICIIAAFRLAFAEFCLVCVVEVGEFVPVLNKRQDYNLFVLAISIEVWTILFTLLLVCFIANYGVIYRDSFQVEVFGVLGGYKAVRYVRHVCTCVASCS